MSDLEKVEDVFKELVWDNLVTSALISLKINVWPVNSIIKIITDKMFSAGILTLDISAIKFRNESDRKAFDSVTVTLKIIGKDKGYQSPEYLNAKENAKKAFVGIVTYRRI